MDCLKILFLLVSVQVNASATIGRDDISDLLANLSTTLTLQRDSSEAVLIGYDCTGPKSAMSVISLKQIEPCHETKVEETPEIRELQVVRRDEYVPIHVYNCKISVQRIALWCGKWSHISILQDGVYSYVHYLGATECMRLHNTGQLSIPGVITVTSLPGNSTILRSVTFHGTLQQDGTCAHGAGTYSDPGGSFSQALVVGSVEVSISDQVVTGIIEEGLLVIPNGPSCKLSDGYCRDYVVGEYTWTDIQQSKCSVDQFSVLFEGAAQIFQYYRDQNDEPERILIINGTSKIGGLKLEKRTRWCTFNGFLTDQPRVYVFMKDTIGWLIPSRPIYAKNVDLALYINTKMVYLGVQTIRTMQTAVGQLQFADCQVRRQELKTRLALVRNHPELAGSLTGDVEGVYGRVMGEAVYLIQCEPVPVRPRITEGCFQDFPVYHNNKVAFLKPLTRLLTTIGSPVDCVPDLISMFEIAGKWWGRNPRLVKGSTPRVLSPNIKKQNLHFEYLFSLGSLGVYTQEELMAVQKEMLFPLIRAAQQDVSMRDPKPKGSDHTNWLSSISDEDLNTLTDKIGKQLSWFFSIFGQWASTIIGIVVLIKVMMYLISVCINCRTLRENKVPPWKYLAAILSSLTHFVTFGLLVRKTPEMQEMDRLLDVGKSRLQDVQEPSAPLPTPEPMNEASSSRPKYKQVTFKYMGPHAPVQFQEV